MPARDALLTLPTPEATARFATRLAPRLAPGDTLLLEGGVGAGKTHFARALIRAVQDRPEDVPSPTFTLVQEYDTRAGPVWHADLYRLGGPDEIEELGLAAAFDSAIVLVEWPDRLAELAPRAALSMRFEDAGDTARRLHLSWQDLRWAARLDGLLP